MDAVALIERPKQIATVAERSTMAGAQAVLNMATFHAIKHTTVFQITGANWDRHLAENALRDCREALAEMEALVAPKSPEDAA